MKLTFPHEAQIFAFQLVTTSRIALKHQNTGNNQNETNLGYVRVSIYYELIRL